MSFDTPDVSCKSKAKRGSWRESMPPVMVGQEGEDKMDGSQESGTTHTLERPTRLSAIPPAAEVPAEDTGFPRSGSYGSLKSSGSMGAGCRESISPASQVPSKYSSEGSLKSGGSRGSWRESIPPDVDAPQQYYGEGKIVSRQASHESHKSGGSRGSWRESIPPDVELPKKYSSEGLVVSRQVSRESKSGGSRSASKGSWRESLPPDMEGSPESSKTPVKRRTKIVGAAVLSHSEAELLSLVSL
eukprot:CAMPEP_0115092680 /NCGR_PEP_ID=MMETSP0227-20121206/26934_1 /TAXON_ID=89957 /ORGANISM="Polarella glacialis, Strain CCMP 1383" /LENGTH=243 /DNA_ID=CAMNT_0002484593 /DNA_START=122 /DNA_END=853 /DNA_ORIENTATION=+